MDASPTAFEPASEPPAGECYRCGYDLRGIEDDRPCPECGLLAVRSRRVTDELHDTRPRWLRTISLGVWMMLLGLAVLVLAPFMLAGIEWLAPTGWRHWSGWVEMACVHGAPLLFLAGIVLLTKREGYAAADDADRLRRGLLRVMAAIPLFLVVLMALNQWAFLLGYGLLTWRRPDVFALARLLAFILTIAAIPLPVLLFYQLRGLAKRARSAHLAEHCAIVGIGASAAVGYGVLLGAGLPVMDRWMADPYWLSRSNIALVLILLASVAAVLFVLWAFYLLVRFAISFHLAARQLHRKWRRDDRAVVPE